MGVKDDLQVAMTRNDVDQVTHLLKNYYLDCHYPLIWACQHGHLDLIKVMLKFLPYRGVDPSIGDHQPFIEACRSGHLAVVQLLLTLDTDPSAQHNQAIWKASMYGHLEVVKLLLSLGRRINPADRNNYALRWARLQGHTEIVTLLLQEPRVLYRLYHRPLKGFESVVNRMKAIDGSYLAHLNITIKSSLFSASGLTVKSMVSLIHGDQSLA